MTPPTADEQIAFLVKLQRLLDEGAFVASYKFALLLALADLCIEYGNDSGAPLKLSTSDIAEQFIEYYWRQVVPYPSPKNVRVLQQSFGKQAAIVNAVSEARVAYGDSLMNAMRNGKAWRALVSRVARVVREMPLFYLQNVGGQRLDFLYGDVGRVIELKGG